MERIIADPEDAHSRITKIIPFIDRMRIWFEKKPNLDQDELGKLCGQVKPHAGYKSWRDPRTGELMFNYNFVYKLEIFQPSREALSYLKKETDCEYRISYIEVALDYIAETINDIAIIRNFLETSWVKRWHSTNRIIRVGGDAFLADYVHHANEGTTYYCRRNASSNYVIYSDKLSKIVMRPCCHLEVRLKGSGVIRRAKLDKFDDFLGADFFLIFWEKHLHLRSIRDIDYVKKGIMKTLRKKKARGNHNVLLCIILRWFTLHGGTYKAQNFLDYGQWVDARNRFLFIVPNKPFLPRTLKG